MSKIYRKLRVAAFPLLVAMTALFIIATASFSQERQYSNQAWSFGVMADTQWTLGVPLPGYDLDPSGQNPNQVAESIAKQIKQQFINKGVKIVFQLGDPSNWAGDASMATNAAGAQMLYSEGINYFPVRGNHNTYDYYFKLDPLTFDADVNAFRTAFPQTQGNPPLFGIDSASFSYPTQMMTYNKGEIYPTATGFFPDDLRGLNYSFDYGSGAGSARFLLLDTNCAKVTPKPFPFTISGFYGSCTARYWVPQQQEWISDRLDGKPTTHAFVFSHQQFIGSNHTDSIFGTTSGKAESYQNEFFDSLERNNVKVFHSGHDHLYNRSLIKRPNLEGDGVMQIISSGASTKYYEPAAAVDSYKLARETELSQELHNVGYYLYTVDGPRVNVDYYSDATGDLQDDYCYPYGMAGAAPRSCANAPGTVDKDGNAIGPLVPGTLYTPEFGFVKKESFGYSLNGKQFKVAPDMAYADVNIEDSFEGRTSARIIGGSNDSGAADYNGRAYSKIINTGWTAKNSPAMASDILSLWGVTNLSSDGRDVYVLEISYQEQRPNPKAKGNAGYRLASLDAKGNWVKAVDLNVGGKGQKFVIGPWNGSLEVGTHGIDVKRGTVWAVINYDADFAAVKF